MFVQACFSFFSLVSSLICFYTRVYLCVPSFYFSLSLFLFLFVCLFFFFSFSPLLFFLSFFLLCLSIFFPIFFKSVSLFLFVYSFFSSFSPLLFFLSFSVFFSFCSCFYNFFLTSYDIPSFLSSSSSFYSLFLWSSICLSIASFLPSFPLFFSLFFLSLFLSHFVTGFNSERITRKVLILPSCGGNRSLWRRQKGREILTQSLIGSPCIHLHSAAALGTLYKTTCHIPTLIFLLLHCRLITV